MEKSTRKPAAELKLRTIKKLSSEIGVSQSFIKQLCTKGSPNGRLTRYKINSATYVSLSEFEALAQATID